MPLLENLRPIGVDSMVTLHRVQALYRSPVRCDSRSMPGIWTILYEMRFLLALPSFARFTLIFGAFVLSAWFPSSLLAATPAQASTPATASAAYELGAAVFAKSGCARCHGGGHGPNLRDVGDHLSETKIRKQIENGGEHMPAYGKILASKQVDSLVHYLSAHREAAEPSAAPVK
jgi:mono/diheme cytochrome c family protein